MLKRFANGFRIGLESFKFMLKKPKLLTAVLIFWLCFIILLSITYGIFYALNIDMDYIESQGLETVFIIVIIFIVLFEYALANSISSLVILELVEQHETNDEMKLELAIKDTFVRDLPKTFLIVLLWSLTNILITIIRMIIQAIFRERIGNSNDKSGPNLIAKGVKIMVLVTLPAIAWEELSAKEAIKKGFDVIKKTWLSVFGSTTFNFLSILIMTVVLGIIDLIIIVSIDVNFGNLILIMLVTVFVLNLFSNILSIMQQVYIANIYLWYQIWEKQNKIDPGVSIEDVKFPSFLDDIQDLLQLERSNNG